MTELPETGTLLLERDDSWLTVWLNRPEARNALSDEMISDLEIVLDAVQDDRSVRGITFRGKGGVFCAGGDLKGFKQGFQGEEQSLKDVEAASSRAGELLGHIETMPQVTLMLVEGAAMAGGLGMVCAGDVVVVTEDAKFALTETTLGIPPAQIAPFVVQRLGLRTAKRIMLTAARFDGATAAAIGLADFVVRDVRGMEQLEKDLRKDVLRCAPGANAVTKGLVLATQSLDRKSMVDRAAKDFATCMLGEEGREGVSAFFEKREPSWAMDDGGKKS